MSSRESGGPGLEGPASSPSESGKIVLEGWLQKRGEPFKNWKSRYFVLRYDGTLVGLKSKPDQEMAAGSQPRNSFTVRDCQIMPRDKPKPFMFVVRGLQLTKVIERLFHVFSEEERDSWIKAIKSVAERLEKVELQLPSRMQGSSSSKDVPVQQSRSVRFKSFGFFGLFQIGSLSQGIDGLCAKFRGPRTLDTKSSEKERVTLESFEFLKVLGSGSFAKVLLCREKSTSQLYAMKILKKKSIVQEGDVAHTHTENRVLRTIKHPFLVSLKYSFQTANRLCFVMEYLNAGDLYLHLRRDRIFSEGRTRFYGAEIVSALGYLHSYGIIYRDLKLENLLLDQDGHIKMVDFGICKENITHEKTTNTLCGTPEYMAPEIVEGHAYGLAVDWWGVGIIMYEMLCGKPPFYSTNHEELYFLIMHEGVEYPELISIGARDLLIGLLKKNPKRRLGGGPNDAKDIMEHFFFSLVIDWSELVEKKITPPFRPEIQFELDTRYFDQAFTNESIELTPDDGGVLSTASRSNSVAEEEERFPNFYYEASDSAAEPSSHSN